MPSSVDISAASPPASPLSRPAAQCAGLYLVALVVFLVNIGERTFWRDEIWQVRLAGEPVGDLVDGVLTETFNGALSIVVTALWLPVVGVHEGALRVPSAVAMAGLAPVVFALGRRFSPLVGVGAAVLTVTSPVVFRYAQEVRPYAFAALLSGASLLLLVRATERDEPRRWWLLAAAYVLLGYSHIYGLLTIAAHGAWLVFVRRSLPIRNLVVPVGVALLPLPVVKLLRETESYDWHSEPDLRVFVRMVTNLLGGRTLAVVLGSAMLAVAVPLVRRLLRERRIDRRDPRTMVDALLVLAVVIPVVGSFLLSQLKPIFLDRYLIVTFPAIAVLAAQGFAMLRRTSLVCALVAVAALLGLLRFPDLPNFRGYEDARSAARVVAAGDRPGDLLVYAAGAAIGFEHYADRIGPERFEVTALAASRGWYGEDEGVPEAQATLRRELESSSAEQVWLVGYDHDRTSRLWSDAVGEVIGEGRRPVRQWSFRGVRLVLFR